MPWGSLVPSQRPRTLPVLWLVVPWSGAWVWAASVAGRSTPADFVARGLFGGRATVDLTGPPLGSALAVWLTWVWLAMAVPVPSRWRFGLWFAAALLAAEWATADTGRDLTTTVAFGVAGGVTYEIVAEARRIRALRRALRTDA